MRKKELLRRIEQLERAGRPKNAAERALAAGKADALAFRPSNESFYRRMDQQSGQLYWGAVGNIPDGAFSEVHAAYVFGYDLGTREALKIEARRAAFIHQHNIGKAAK